MNSSFKGACAVAVLLCGPAIAAPTLTVNSVSVVGDAVTITAPYAAGSTTAGPVTLGTNQGFFVAWCIDIYHEIFTGGGQSLNYQIGAPTTNSAPSPQTLSTSTLNRIGQLAQYGQSLIGTAAATNDNLAAVQLAIWSVEYPTFAYTGASAAPVAATITAASSEPVTDAGLLALDGTQTFVTADPRAIAQMPVFSGVPPVPEPAAMGLLASALAGLGLVRRRSRSAAGAA